ncbi:MAG: putative selenium-dependent hydroxylase accessory protein YqeC [Clostridiales bacterium]|nr:putative selenium-dependent hydroxylase accessory protein YqeC [Clostridiales bacterium]
MTDILNIKRGLTSIAGSGGKTTLMYALAAELSKKGRVIVCTTTKIYRPENIITLESLQKEEIKNIFADNNILCAGKDCGEGKITAPDMPFSKLLEAADYVICEADGSKGLPLKAHAEYEPVIPAESAETIGVLSISGVNKRIANVCHRPEIFAKLAGLDINDIAAPKDIAEVIKKEGLFDRFIINQVKTKEQLSMAEEIAKELGIPVFAGEIRKGRLICLRS